MLPRGPDGHPIPHPDSQEYYHPKEGIFDDADGNRLAFSGSTNESRRGWRKNYETFHVFASWARHAGPDPIAASEHHVAPIERRFAALWQADDPDWIALSLPRAVQDRLLKHVPSKPPTVDPLERRPSPHERPTFRFLRDAPFLPDAARIGVETAAVTPWPHQNRVIDAVVERFPRSFLFCDEVGLGKTIEAGLALRQLIVTKRVRRSLILAPASVVRQWQEELWEKCALDIPRYERGALVDVRGAERRIAGPPWGRVDHLIASSQLAKRTDRRDEVLEPRWDLVLVDEAHHARRKEFGIRARRPNHLLQLLGGHGRRPGLKDRTRCLYLLTATPNAGQPGRSLGPAQAAGPRRALGSERGALPPLLRGDPESVRPARLAVPAGHGQGPPGDRGSHRSGLRRGRASQARTGDLERRPTPSHHDQGARRHSGPRTCGPIRSRRHDSPSHADPNVRLAQRPRPASPLPRARHPHGTGSQAASQERVDRIHAG